MKKSFLMMFAAASIVSCTQTEINEVPGTGEPVAIQLRSVNKIVVTETGTRVPYIGAISAGNPLTARVLSATTAGNYTSALHENAEMTFVGGTAPSAYDALTLSAPGKGNFPGAATEPLYLAGLYPTTGWTLAGTPTVGTIAITGKEDVMTASQVTTTANEVKDGTIQTLTFKHMLTKLEIGLQAVTNAAAGKWGKVTKIELVKVNGATPQKTIAVTLSTGAVSTPSSPTTGTMPLYAMSEAGGTTTYTNNVYINGNTADYATLTEAGTVVAYTLIAPLTSGTPTDLTFHVYTEVNGSTPAIVNVPLSTTGDTTGRAYNITFTFSADDTNIQAAAQVIDWVESGDITAPVN